MKVRYSCNQCEYEATTQSNLKKHIESDHEKIRYSCNQCEYEATTQSNLNKHIESDHEKVGCGWLC